MPNPNIRIKGATGSLTRRAALISLCLLVVPLFLHSLFLYWQDYRHNLQEVIKTLQLTAKAQQFFLEDRIALQWQMLDEVEIHRPPTNKQLHLQTFSVSPATSKYFAIISTTQDALIVGKKTGDTTALGIIDPLAPLFDILARFEDKKYPTSLSFIDDKGNALAGATQKTPLFVKLPIKDTDFFLYLSIAREAAEELNQRSYWSHFLSLLFTIGGLGGLFVWILTRRIAKPLQTLSKAMNRVAEGGIHVRYEPDSMGFEINELGKQFNETLDRLLHHQQEAEREKIARERLAEELKIGHEIQISLLPNHLPELKGLDIAKGFVPAREVGGDFYDFFSLENGSLLIAIADTAGKGISACLYSLGLRSMLRTLAASGNSLSEIVLQANELFRKDVQHSGMFVTLWIGIYNPDTKMLDYCCQGHPPALLLREGHFQNLGTSGMAIGATSFDAVSVKQIVLLHDDLLFLYTDGVIEAHDVDNHLFGIEKLQNFLLHSSTLSSQTIVSHLLQEIALFSQDIQHDDITMIAMRLNNSAYQE